MLYKVFTDAAARPGLNKSGVAFTILQNKDYVYSFGISIQEGDITSAEIYAVCIALKYCQTKLTEDPELEVVIYTDNEAAYVLSNIFLKMKSENRVDKRPRKYKDNAAICELFERVKSSNFKLTVKKHKAHLKGLNPHAMADRLAKNALCLGGN